MEYSAERGSGSEITEWFQIEGGHRNRENAANQTVSAVVVRCNATSSASIAMLHGHAQKGADCAVQRASEREKGSPRSNRRSLEMLTEHGIAGRGIVWNGGVRGNRDGAHSKSRRTTTTATETMGDFEGRIDCEYRRKIE